MFHKGIYIYIYIYLKEICAMNLAIDSCNNNSPHPHAKSVATNEVLV